MHSNNIIKIRLQARNQFSSQCTFNLWNPPQKVSFIIIFIWAYRSTFIIDLHEIHFWITLQNFFNFLLNNFSQSYFRIILVIQMYLQPFLSIIWYYWGSSLHNWHSMFKTKYPDKIHVLCALYKPPPQDDRVKEKDISR